MGPGTDPEGVMSVGLAVMLVRSPLARIVACDTEDGLCITLCGELDMTNAEDVRAQLLEAV